MMVCAGHWIVFLWNSIWPASGSLFTIRLEESQWGIAAPDLVGVISCSRKGKVTECGSWQNLIIASQPWLLFRNILKNKRHECLGPRNADCDVLHQPIE